MAAIADRRTNYEGEMIHESDTIATSCGVEIKSPSPVLSLYRRLVAQACDPAVGLQAFRGDVLALTVRSIGEAATLQIASHGVGFTRARDGGGRTAI